MVVEAIFAPYYQLINAMKVQLKLESAKYGIMNKINVIIDIIAEYLNNA